MEKKWIFYQQKSEDREEKPKVRANMEDKEWQEWVPDERAGAQTEAQRSPAYALFRDTPSIEQIMSFGLWYTQPLVRAAWFGMVC